MPIKVTCSNCGGVLHAPDDAGGKRGRCPTCGNVLPIPADAPKLPAAPLTGSAKESANSFGDFNLGPQVSPPVASPPKRPAPGTAAGIPLMDAPASARSSVPSLAEPTVSPRRGKPVPPPYPPEGARKTNDPFARKSSAKAEGDVSDGVIRRWKRVRGGLWWVRAAIPFFLLPILALNGLKLYEHFVAPLPVKDPGYLNQSWLTSVQELEIVAVMAPFAFGVFLLMIGRFGVSNVPHKAHAHGLSLFAALATLLAVCAGIAIVFPALALIALGEKDLPFVVRANGEANWQLMLPGDPEGIMQRLGLIVGAAALIVAEFWFASALGRIGTALHSGRLAGRATRYLILLGLTLGILIASGALAPAYNFGAMPRDVSADTGKLTQTTWNDHGEPLLNKLGAERAAARAGLFILGGLCFAGIYWRMVGAGRGAVREWLDVNGRT